MAKVYFFLKKRDKLDTLRQRYFSKSMCGIPCPRVLQLRKAWLCRRWAFAEKWGDKGVPTPRALPQLLSLGPVLALCLPLLKVPSKWSLFLHTLLV